MKIRITSGSKDIIQVQELLRDLGIKQPTFGYSDIFVVPKNDWIEVQRHLNRMGVEWEMSKKQKNESKISSWINQIITEEIQKFRLKENQSQQEIEDLAVDLIDYMGKQLPVTGWNKHPRIMGFFREQGILDGKIIQQIYQKALQLNQE